MDTQQAANLANIENARLSRKLVYIGWATLIVCSIGTVFAAWVVLRPPDASNAPPAGDGFMLTKWLPVILLGTSSLVVATALILVAFRQWRNRGLAKAVKRLAEENNTLKAEMATRQACLEPRLHQLAETDKQSLEHLVKVFIIDSQPQFGDDLPNPFIDFRIALFNLSLYDVIVAKPIAGYITFLKEGKQYRDGFMRKPVLWPIDPHDNADVSPCIPSRGDIGIRVRQWLSREEATYISTSGPKSAFWFHELRIELAVNGTTSKRLYTGHIMTKDERWQSYSDPPTCFAYDTARGFEVGERAAMAAEIESLKSSLDRIGSHKLTFEIDDKDSQVHMSGGREVRRIQANIKLRCLKSDDSGMAVRDFHASLHKQSPNGEETVIAREGAIIAMSHPKMVRLGTTDGWLINSLITQYRWYEFFLDLSPEMDDQLSREHFLRVTMLAVGQDPFSVDFYVNSWNDARQSNSYITLRKPNDYLIRNTKKT